MALTVALLKAEQDVLVIDSNEKVINDVAHLTMGENVLAKKLGAKDVTTRANNHNHRLVLEKIGADHVIEPEQDMA